MRRFLRTIRAIHLLIGHFGSILGHPSGKRSRPPPNSTAAGQTNSYPLGRDALSQLVLLPALKNHGDVRLILQLINTQPFHLINLQQAVDHLPQQRVYIPPPLMLRNGPRDAHSKLLCGPTLDERRDPVYEFIDGDAQGPKIGLFTVVVEDESFG